MAYNFEITCFITDEEFDSIDFAIFATIEKEIRERIGAKRGLLPDEVYLKAIQHALWTLEKEVKEKND